MIRSSTHPDERFVLFPIEMDDVFKMYKKAVACFWTPEEIEFERDLKDWNEHLTEDERTFVKQVLSFFAASDGIVNENLAERFLREVDIAEIRFFYGFQIAIENIHNECYSLMIDTLCGDGTEKAKCLQGAKHSVTIKDKQEWAQRWIESDTSTFGERLLAFACVEGIMFSSSFAAIFWLKKRNLLTNGLGKSNELIARDEGLHRDFAVLLFRKYLSEQPDVATVHRIVREAVDLEKRFVQSALQTRLIGMNSDLMCQYVEFVADHLLKSLGVTPLYHHANCPLDYMENISLEGRSNFFETRVSEYARAGVMAERSEQTFSLNADF